MSTSNSIRKLFTKNLVDLGQALVSLSLPGEVITDDLSTAWREVGIGNILRMQTSGDTFVAFHDSDQGVGTAEVTPFTCVADVGDSLDGTFFILYETAGSVAFWFDVDNSGTTIPAGAAAASRAVEITTIVTNDADTVVAGKVDTAVNADAGFSAPGAAGAVVTATAAVVGIVQDFNAGDSGFSVGSITQGTGQIVSVLSSPGLKLVGAEVHYVVAQCNWIRTDIALIRVEKHRP